ncbi:MAG: NAD(P)-dependent oxidoreductase [Calditrichia bacterium]
MANIFVTGGTGFVGKAVIDRLLDQNHHVYALVRNPDKCDRKQGDQFTLIQGSLDKPFTIPSEVEYIIHIAGVTKANNYDEYFKGNVLTTENLLTSIRQSKLTLKRLVGISSQAVAGPSQTNMPLTEDAPPRPLTWYGETKLIAEQKLLEFGKEYSTCIIRPPAVYGPRDADILNVFKFLKYGLNLKIGRKEQYVSVVYVYNLADGIIRAMTHPQAHNQVFYITDEGSYAWSELVDMIATIMNKKYITISLPYSLAKVVAGIIEYISGFTGKPTILNRQKMIEVNQQYWLCSSEKAKTLLNFSPTVSTSEALTETYKWYVSAGWL